MSKSMPKTAKAVKSSPIKVKFSHFKNIFIKPYQELPPIIIAYILPVSALSKK
jgi:hypothetical protein